MKTIRSLKDVITLEVGDKVVFGDLEYVVRKNSRNRSIQYYLSACIGHNNTIFEILNLQKRDFVEKLGIIADSTRYYDFPETKSLEVLAAIVSALFKEYEKQNELPKTWEEFCERCPLKAKEVFINSASKIITVGDYISRKYRIPDNDRNLCTSKQEAEAFLALMQLRQLRKVYVKDWEPEWNDTKQYKACIMYTGTDFIITYFNDSCSRPLSFPTHELATQFLTNFKDLLEIAKPLL